MQRRSVKGPPNTRPVAKKTAALIDQVVLRPNCQQGERDMEFVQRRCNGFQLIVEIGDDQSKARSSPAEQLLNLGKSPRRPHAAALELLEEASRQFRREAHAVASMAAIVVLSAEEGTQRGRAEARPRPIRPGRL